MDQNIQKIADVLEMPLALFMAYDRSKADGKVDINDIPNFITPLLKLPQIINDSHATISALKSLSPDSIAQLTSSLKMQFDISDNVLEAKIEAGAEWVLATAKLVGALK